MLSGYVHQVFLSAGLIRMGSSTCGCLSLSHKLQPSLPRPCRPEVVRHPPKIPLARWSRSHNPPRNDHLWQQLMSANSMAVGTALAAGMVALLATCAMPPRMPAVDGALIEIRRLGPWAAGERSRLLRATPALLVRLGCHLIQLGWRERADRPVRDATISISPA